MCMRGHTGADSKWKDGHCKLCRLARKEEMKNNPPSFCPKGHIRTYETVYTNGGCKACAKLYLQRKDIRGKHDIRVRDYHLRKAYGISTEQYNAMLLKQKGRCFLCEKTTRELKKNFAVDHNHKTGEVRALLCSLCNTGLGAFKEDISLMEKAINYLKDKSYVR